MMLMNEIQRFQLLSLIAFLPSATQEYNIPNGKQNRNEMEVLNRYNEMHTKDYGKLKISPTHFFSQFFSPSSVYEPFFFNPEF